MPNELACAIAELIAAASGVGASFADVCIPAAVFKAAPEPLGGHFKLLKIVSLQALTTLPGEMAQQLGIIRTPKKDEEEPKKILENKLRMVDVGPEPRCAPREEGTTRPHKLGCAAEWGLWAHCRPARCAVAGAGGTPRAAVYILPAARAVLAGTCVCVYARGNL